jgi:hypothetical protein
MSGLRAALRVASAGSGVGWTRLCDYTEAVSGELIRREPAVAGVPLILTWSGTLTVGGSRFDSGFVAGPADRYADTRTTGHARGVQVDLTWLGARRLLGLPLDDSPIAASPWMTCGAAMGGDCSTGWPALRVRAHG